MSAVRDLETALSGLANQAQSNEQLYAKLMISAMDADTSSGLVLMRGMFQGTLFYYLENEEAFTGLVAEVTYAMKQLKSPENISNSLVLMATVVTQVQTLRKQCDESGTSYADYTAAYLAAG